MTDLVELFRTLARAARDHGTEYASVTHEEADQAAAEIERLRELVRQSLDLVEAGYADTEAYLAEARASLSKASGEGV